MRSVFSSVHIVNPRTGIADTAMYEGTMYEGDLL